MLRTKWMGALAALVTFGVFMVASPSHAGTCNKTDGLFSATIHVNVNNNPPTIVCQSGVDVIEISFSILHDDQICEGYGPTKVCGNTNGSIITFQCGVKTVVKPATGKTWADAAANCNDLVFDVPGN